MQLFYAPEINESNRFFTFSKEESRHIIKVLRKSSGDRIHITDGLGKEFACEIREDNPKHCEVEIIESFYHNKEWNYHLHLFVAPTKNMDRFEWFVEKCTEIGIDEITPIICDHSERKLIKIERIEKIAIAAAKQSLKWHFPKINAMTTFKDVINTSGADQNLIAHCYDEAKLGLFDSLDCNKPKINLFIGPEGDFSLEEVQYALDKDYRPISLGKSRLRTETAGVVACHTVSLKFEI